MTDAAKRKSLKDAYRDKPTTGGIYRIRCEGNRREWIRATCNLEGQQNRYGFAVATNTAPEPGMSGEWRQYGAASFSFAVLETLTKKKDQTDQEFKEDVDALLDMWLDKNRPDA